MAISKVNGIEYNIGEDIHGDITAGRSAGDVSAKTSQNSVVDKFKSIKEKYNIKNYKEPNVIPSKTESVPPRESGLDLLRRFGMGVGQAAMNAGQTIAQGAGDVVGGVGKAFSGDVLGGAQQVGQGTLTAAQGYGQALTAPMQPVVDFAVNSAKKTGEAAWQGLQRTGGGLGQLAQAIPGVFGNMFAPVTQEMIQETREGRDPGSKAFKGVNEAISGVFDTLFAPVGGAVQASDPMIQNGMRDAGQFFSDIANGTIDIGLGAIGAATGVDVNDPNVQKEKKLFMQSLDNGLKLLTVANVAGSALGVNTPASIAGKAAQSTLKNLNISQSPIYNLPKEALDGMRRAWKSGMDKAANTIQKAGVPQHVTKTIFKTELDDVLSLQDDVVAKTFLENGKNINYMDDLYREVDDSIKSFNKDFVSSIDDIVELKKQVGNLSFKVPKNFAKDIIKKELRLVDDGAGGLQMNPTPGKSVFLSPAELKRVNELVNSYSDFDVSDVLQYKDMMSPLDDLSKWNTPGYLGSGSSQAARSLRTALKDKAHLASPALKAADEGINTARATLDSLTGPNGILNKTKAGYELKSTFMEPENLKKLLKSNKYSKAINVLEQKVPDLTQRIQAARLIDIAQTSGPITGGQIPAFLVGSAGGSLVGGPAGAVVGLAAALAANPKALLTAMAKYYQRSGKAASAAGSGAAKESVRQAASGAAGAAREGAKEAFTEAANQAAQNPPPQL